VTGAIGRLIPRTDVLAIMFTPSGAFCRVENSGFERWRTEYAPCAISHSNQVWSLGRCEETRWLMSTQ
jgi:hypothetical protein